MFLCRPLRTNSDRLASNCYSQYHRSRMSNCMTVVNRLRGLICMLSLYGFLSCDQPRVQSAMQPVQNHEHTLRQFAVVVVVVLAWLHCTVQ